MPAAPAAPAAPAVSRNASAAVGTLDPDVVRRVAVCLDDEVCSAFARLTRVAAGVTGAPVALVSLVEGGRLHFRGHIGLPEPFASLREAPLANSFCEHIVVAGTPLIVHDARTSAVHRQKPAFQQLGVVAYLGVPLRTPTGVVLGTLCLIDTRARRWSEADLAHLEDVARCVLTEVELRAALAAVRAAPLAPLAPPASRPELPPASRPEARDSLREDATLPVPATPTVDIRALYERHAPTVYGLLLTLTDPEGALRLLAATFERAAARLAEGGAPCSSGEATTTTAEAMSAWLCRLALGRAQRAGLFSLTTR